MMIQISQADRRPLNRIKTIMQFGRVNGPYLTKGRPTTKPIYVYRVHGQKQTQRFAALVWPWLGEPKREQFTRAGMAPCVS